MKTDKNGTSTTERGQEQWEEYFSSIANETRVQYDYRTRQGRLFSCIAKSLAQARAKRDAWLSRQDHALAVDSEI